MKKVLVTGISGFLGKHIQLKLEELGWNYEISNTKTANLIDEKNLHIYNDCRFDYIFHLATYTKGGDFCLHYAGDQFEINQQINTNILKYWKHYQPQAKMIGFGTSFSYTSDYDMSEENYMLGEPSDEQYAYAMVKRMLLVGMKCYAKQYGLKYLYFIPSTMYGEEFHKDDNHFIFDLIKKIHNGYHYGNEVELWGDGYQTRELVYVKDAVEIIFNTLEYDNEILNIGRGIEYSIRDYATEICKAYNFDFSKIVFNVNKYTGSKSKKFNVEKIFTLYPDLNFTPLDVGLNKTINYYRNLK